MVIGLKRCWVVVRHAKPEDVAQIVCPCEACVGQSPGGYYPAEGFAITAFDEEERARSFAESSSSGKFRYEAIPMIQEGVVDGR